MSDANASRQRRARRVTPAPAQPVVPTAEIVGRVLEPVQAGEDARKRGWFWHWNTIVTQFAPLIGLKGVGLLNSYTVWTDRRDESAYRGYAFPSQQSEAAFYGVDRAELIAINKILVALDLIEIRKEMVTRVDEQGRKWRVPHNLYRVKDHGDHYNLTTRDVVKVIELAEKDRAVYRQIKHVFSERFAPIDPQNVWWSILDELRDHAGWQRLAAKTAADENRASARTKAGHAARKASFYLAGERDNPTPNDSDNDSTAVKSQESKKTSVAQNNNGSEVDVAIVNNGLHEGVEPGNRGSSRKQPSIVEPVNQGEAGSVAPGNTIKDQYLLTTTTTSENQESEPENREYASGVPGLKPETEEWRLGRETRAVLAQGPGQAQPPADAPAEQAAIQAFEDANNRPSTTAERNLLRDVATRTELDAWRQRGDRISGWEWVKDAVYEAVESGSRYVAPRRLREIIARWQRDGRPVDAEVPSEEPGEIRLGERTDLSLPHGFGSRRTWSYAVARMTAALDRATAEALFTGTAIAAYHEGEITIAVINERQVDQLSGPYRTMVERALGEAMRRPVRLSLISPAPEPDPIETNDEPEQEGDGLDASITFLIPGSGMNNEQFWQAVQAELAANGEIAAANLGSWIRPARLIAMPEPNLLVIGAPHAPAQRRIASQYTRPLERACSRLLGRDIRLEVVTITTWRGPFGLPDAAQAG
jgi:hypothetical protein